MRCVVASRSMSRVETISLIVTLGRVHFMETRISVGDQISSREPACFMYDHSQCVVQALSVTCLLSESREAVWNDRKSIFQEDVVASIQEGIAR